MHCQGTSEQDSQNADNSPIAEKRSRAPAPLGRSYEESSGSEHAGGQKAIVRPATEAMPGGTGISGVEARP
jgi:hypothetical protein